MVEIARYRPELKGDWDELVRNSKNGTFLFCRDYMEYHSNRFADCSFTVYKKNKMIGIIPGHISGKTFYSHKGLTYGGFVFSNETKLKDVLESFRGINDCLKRDGIEEVIYKPVPYHYHRIPAQEDVYSIFLINGIKIGCNIASVVTTDDRIPIAESRKSGLRKGLSSGIRVMKSDDYDCFWKILNDNLKDRHNAKPVHSLEEIERLKYLFPENIELYVAEHDGIMVGGTVIFITKNVARVQYISANAEGKAEGALDLLFFELINNAFKNVKCFDFGTSNDLIGNELKEGLLFQKEGFGGRGIVYETYSYLIK